MAQPYISPPIETDPQVLVADAYELIQSYWPDWEPNEGNLEVILLQAVAQMVAELREVASDVPAAILAYFGASVLGIPRQDAVEATATTDWTMQDAAGYTVEQGTLVGIPVTGSDVQPFETVADFTVAPGDTVATGVELRAVNEGAAANDATGTPYLLDVLGFVTTIALTAGPSGGIDEETVDEYLNKLVGRFQILSPTPIRAPDFAVMATDIAGVDRATAVDNFLPGVNERQQVTIDATGGQWTWSHGGQTASALAWNISAAALQAAIEALSNFAPGDVVVTGGPGATAPLVVEFTGAYAKTNVAAATTTDTLTGGAGTATVTTLEQGVPDDDAAERAVTVAALDEDGAGIGGAVKAALDAYLQEQREDNFIVSVIDPTVSEVDVDFSVVAEADADAVTVGAAAEAAVASYLDPANWGRTSPDFADWTNRDTVYVNDLVTLLEQVEGVERVVLGSVELAVSPAATTAADLTLPGVIPLPTAGTITATVT